MGKLVDILLPEGQLEGTSATLANWLVKPGDQVKQGDPIAELETDKVVMEICAAADGQIQSLAVNVGESVATEQVLGQIDCEDTQSSPESAPNSSLQSINTNAIASDAVADDSLGKTSIAAQPNNPQSASTEARQFISPAVRRLLGENNLTIENIAGSGKRGRVTRDDVLAYLSQSSQKPQSGAYQASKNISGVSGPTAAKAPLQSRPLQSRPLQGSMVTHSKMRKSIANHMVESLLHTSPHVTSVFEMDMSNIIEHRKWHKKEYAECQVKLTFTAYFLAAMAKAVKAVPQTNARFHADALEIFEDVNIGVGTALGDAGLVVPVVEQVQQMNLFEIAQNLNRQTEKARAGKLMPSDMRNGTITISNHGVSGSLFAAPIIINQPEVAILGIGKLEKRVVVEPINGVDTMVIRPKCYVSLSIDHRALDAHQTNQFLSVFVKTIENWGE